MSQLSDNDTKSKIILRLSASLFLLFTTLAMFLLSCMAGLSVLSILKAMR